VHTNKKQFSGSWAIILGGSSGFGFATVEKLAMHGMNIAVIYRETAAGERLVKERFSNLAETCEVNISPFNINALDASARNNFMEKFASDFGKKHSVRLLLHSIARGNLKPLVLPAVDPDTSNELLSVEDINLTTYAMSTSILDWARSILKAELFQPDARIIGLTSEGAHKYWEGYAAVSIAKASLASLTTYMAVEFCKYGIKTNLIHAGITETASLKRIPGSDELIRISKDRNPMGRMTQPGDVANVVYLLCTEEAAWINGAVIQVDGGEHCR
jgi:enoyl-[acyl-carrier protein] reductase III